MSTETKATIRSCLLSQREKLTAQEVHDQSLLVFQQFQISSEKFLPKEWNFAGLYFSTRGEVDTEFFFQEFTHIKKKCLFPKIIDQKLQFYLVESFSNLEKNKYGILEPKTSEETHCIKPDIVLIPGIAFDYDGHRIGFGGGYYDRTIQEWVKHYGKSKPLLIGLAYDFQLYSKLPYDTNDSIVDRIVTESNYYETKRH